MKVYDSQGRLKTIAAAASVEPTSAQFSVLSNTNSVQHTALSVAINVVSNSLSQLQSVHDVLSNRVSANSATGGAGSVTSNEASAISAQAASAINVVSNAVSNEISNRVSADNVLSTAIDVVSNALSQRASVISQQQSVQNDRIALVSAAITSVSALSVGVSAKGLQSAVNALSNTISNEASVRAASVQTASAAATSADAHANTVSARVVSVSAELASLVQIASAAATSADGHANTVSAAANAISARVVSVSAELASLVQIASAAATSADAHANTASAAATSVDARVNSVNVFISGISALSLGGISTHGLQSVVNALSNRISAVTGGSVTSNELSAVSAQAASAINVVSNAASIVSARVVSVSAELASLVQIASAAATSADGHANTVSARVVSVSAELASLVQIASAAATSADGHANTVSAAANTISARVVSVSAELGSLIQIASAAATSADGHANTVSARVVSVSAELASLVQIASAAATSVDGRVNSVNAAISAISARSVGDVSTHGFQSIINALSNRISAGGGTGSVTSNEASAISAQAASAISAVSARVVSVSAELASLVQIASAAATSVDARVNSVNTFISGVSARSVGGISTHGFQSVVNALSNRISAVIAGATSVTSTEVSIVSANAAANLSADHFISLQNVDTISLVYGMPVRAGLSVNTMARAGLGTWNSISAQVVGLIADAAVAVSAVGRVQIRGAMAFTSTQFRSVAATASAISAGKVYLLGGTGEIGAFEATGNVGLSRIGMGLDTRTLLLQIGGHPADQNLSDKISVLSQQVSAMSQRVSAQIVSVNAILAPVTKFVLINDDAAAVSAGSPVYFGASVEDSFKLANASVASTRDVIGLVSASSIALSDSGNVRVGGLLSLTTAQWDARTGDTGGLTAGSKYYLGVSAGTLTKTAPTTGRVRPIGVALRATALKLQLGLVDDFEPFISAISARSVGGISTHGLQSVVNALSNRISAVVAGAASVTSTELSAVSAQAASAINVVSARVVSVSAELASLVQIASAAATSADGHANTVSARVVSVSAELASLVQIASAAATSVDGRVNSVNTFISGISALSAGVSTHGLQSVINALSNRISAIPGAGSVNVVGYVSGGQAICAAAFTDISGLCVSVSAGAIYDVRGLVTFSCSAATGASFTIVFPTMSVAAGIMEANYLDPPAGSAAYSAITYGKFGTGGSGSALISANFAAGIQNALLINGMFNVNTTGVWKVQARGSVATNTVTILPGSFIRVFKLR